MGAHKLKILADHNIPSLVFNWLHNLRRVDLATAAQRSLLRAEDDVLVKCATDEGRILLAGDKVFSEHNYEVCTHAGIVNVSRFNTRPWSMREKLAAVLRRARPLLGHNVVHLGDDEFWVVERGNKKQTFKYH